MAQFTVPADVRDYLTVTGTTGQWSTSLIGSNIVAASNNLQRWTNRQFEVQGSNTAVTKRFSTEGRSFIVIPDLRPASSVILNSATLVADESYYLHADRQQSGVYVGIEFPFRRGGYLNRFDINYRYLDRTTLPNDLSITGVWGHLPLPGELIHATNVLSAFYTIRPDALFSGARQTPEGNVFDLSRLPLEVQNFVNDWRLEDRVMVL